MNAVDVDKVQRHDSPKHQNCNWEGTRTGTPIEVCDLRDGLLNKNVDKLLRIIRSGGIKAFSSVGNFPWRCLAEMVGSDCRSEDALGNALSCQHPSRCCHLTPFYSTHSDFVRLSGVLAILIRVRIITLSTPLVIFKLRDNCTCVQYLWERLKFSTKTTASV